MTLESLNMLHAGRTALAQGINKLADHSPRTKRDVLTALFPTIPWLKVKEDNHGETIVYEP